MYGFLLGVEIIISILLIIAILMQSSKGGGLAGTFGGANIGTVFGVRRTADFLSRTTSVLATLFVLLSLVINIFFLPGKSDSSGESIIQQSGTQQQSLPPPQLPPSSQPGSNPSSPAATPEGGLRPEEGK